MHGTGAMVFRTGLFCMEMVGKSSLRTQLWVVFWLSFDGMELVHVTIDEEQIVTARLWA